MFIKKNKTPEITLNLHKFGSTSPDFLYRYKP